VRFKNSFQINFSDVLAPAPCQSKSSGKPEINHQEFTQLQQQLQDMKEQVRKFYLSPFLFLPDESFSQKDFVTT